MEPGKNPVRSTGQLPRGVGMGLGKLGHAGAELARNAKSMTGFCRCLRRLEEWAYIKWPKPGHSIPDSAF